ncbi:MAG: S1 RNA-binding domain-containing protein [Patescibacteria group bacterium]
MENIIEKENIIRLPKTGDIVESRVIGKRKSSLFLDLGGFKTGIIYGREYQSSREELKNLKTGDKLFAKVIELENEDGYIELSLSQAGRELAWENLRKKKEKDEIFEIKILGANKGGLLSEISGIPAFLPVSQLAQEHYPKVEGGDVLKILKELQNLIGKELKVKVLDFSQKESKIILSEKAKNSEKIKEVLKKYKVGDVIKGEITAVLDFGAFVKIEQGDTLPEPIEGLIHISELDWQLVENPSQIVKVGEKVEAKIIDISNGKISLSLKALKKDPWEDIEKHYKKGDTVKAKVTKLNPFGAFVQLLSQNAPQIQGLIHISEFGTRAKMTESLKIGQEYEFQIISIEPQEHRMILKLA